MCAVKPYHVLAERCGLFAVRHPSLSPGNGLLECGITFYIFTHVYMGHLILLKYIKKHADIKNTQ